MSKILNDVQIFDLNVSLWSGKRRMKPEDLPKDVIDKLPPDELASLGDKWLINRDELAEFVRLRRRAERSLQARGVRFLGGYAIPIKHAQAAENEVNAIKAEFDAELNSFLARYQQRQDDWKAKNPEWAAMLSNGELTSSDLASRISMEVFTYQINVDSTSSSLSEAAENLGGTLFSELSKAAQALFDNSISGTDSLSRKAVTSLNKLLEKLESCSMLHSGAAPLVQQMNDLIEELPKTGSVEGRDLEKVTSIVLMLCDAERAMKHGEALLAGNAPALYTASQATTVAEVDWSAVNGDDDEEDCESDDSESESAVAAPVFASLGY